MVACNEILHANLHFTFEVKMHHLLLLSHLGPKIYQQLQNVFFLMYCNVAPQYKSPLVTTVLSSAELCILLARAL